MNKNFDFVGNYWSMFNILDSLFDEFGGCKFYNFIFPDNENSGDDALDYSKPNAIYLYSDVVQDRLRRRIMLADVWEDDYCEFVENNKFTLCSGLSYRGSFNRAANAQNCNALVFDLDGVEPKYLGYLLDMMDKGTWLPRPTFLALSGGGLHLYYVFDFPIALFPNIKIQMKTLKWALTRKIWIKGSTTRLKSQEVQYQGISQGFRMVGSINSKYASDLVVRAFKTGEKVSLDYLNGFVSEENRVDILKKFKDSKHTLAEAKEKFPEWYQRVIVERQAWQKWDIKGKQGYALYNWWLNRAGEGVAGARYYYMMMLVIYAIKCDKPYEDVKSDLYDIVYPNLKNVDHENDLTHFDVECALECYDQSFFTYPIKDIEMKTHIRIDRNKRNYREQSEHLKVARFIRDEVNGQKDSWRNKEGRPLGSGTKEQVVKEWQEKNTSGSKYLCAKETGLSKNTIKKWWNDGK